MKKLTDLLIIIILSIGVYIPFLKKPYDVDDWATLHFASEIKKGDIIPFSCTYKVVGEVFPCIKVSHPPAVFFIYSLFFKNPKEADELKSHIISLSLFLLGSLSIYYLVLKFVDASLFASLLVIFSPAVLINAFSIMLDIPTFSFFVCSMVLFIYGTELNRSWEIYISIILGLMAIFSSYQAILIIPILLVYTIVSRNKLRTVCIYSCVIIAVFLIWNIYCYKMFGRLHLLEAGTDFRPPIPFISLLSQQLSNLFFYSISIGSILVFPVTFLFLYDFKRIFKKIPIYLIILLPFSLLMAILKVSVLNILLANIFLVAGISFLQLQFLQIIKALKSKNYSKETILSFWFILILIFVTIFLRYGSVRYMILLVPPFIIQIVSLIQKRFGNKGIERKILIFCIFATALYSLILTFADYENGIINKKVVNAIKMYKNKTNKIWFCEELGLRTYLEKEGFNYLLRRDNSPREGDYVIRSEIFSYISLNPLLERRLELIRTIKLRGKIPVRLLSIEAHAGFYRSNWWCILPFAISKKATRNFYIYKVRGQK